MPVLLELNKGDVRAKIFTDKVDQPLEQFAKLLFIQGHITSIPNAYYPPKGNG